MIPTQIVNLTGIKRIKVFCRIDKDCSYSLNVKKEIKCAKLKQNRKKKSKTILGVKHKNCHYDESIRYFAHKHKLETKTKQTKKSSDKQKNLFESCIYSKVFSCLLSVLFAENDTFTVTPLIPRQPIALCKLTHLLCGNFSFVSSIFSSFMWAETSANLPLFYQKCAWWSYAV